MCTGVSTIAYGIVIKTWTLLIASKGFSKIKPILLALDLILLRNKLGKLQVDGGIEGKKNFGDLPFEIIEIVKRELFSTVDKREEAENYLEQLSCSRESFCRCYECVGHLNKHKLGEDYRDVSQGNCAACRDILVELTLDLDAEVFTDILEYYGLIASPTDFITGDDEYDINKSFLIVSIPISNSSVESQTDYDSARSSAIPLYFTTCNINVAGAACRFKRLVTDWNLKLYDEPVQVMGELGGGRAEDDEEEKSLEKKQVKEVKIEPKWMVVSHTRDCQ